MNTDLIKWESEDGDWTGIFDSKEEILNGISQLYERYKQFKREGWIKDVQHVAQRIGKFLLLFKVCSSGYFSDEGGFLEGNFLTRRYDVKEGNTIVEHEFDDYFNGDTKHEVKE